MAGNLLTGLWSLPGLPQLLPGVVANALAGSYYETFDLGRNAQSRTRFRARGRFATEGAWELNRIRHTMLVGLPHAILGFPDLNFDFQSQLEITGTIGEDPEDWDRDRGITLTIPGDFWSQGIGAAPSTALCSFATSPGKYRTPTDRIGRFTAPTVTCIWEMMFATTGELAKVLSNTLELFWVPAGWALDRIDVDYYRPQPTYP